MNQRRTFQREALPLERRRSFTDSHGIYWEVREADNPGYDRRGGVCLIFESADAVRRVRTFPADWFQQSDADLEALSRSR